GGHIAHLGGALFGFIFIKQLQNGMDFSKPFYAVTDFFSNLFKKKSKLKVEYKKEYVYTSEKTTKTNTAQQKETASKQEKLDAILDKINRSSYESLSKEEKEFLFKISQED
ncbi:MAG TPA: rhomboid family intramembrane serine protease, partial [Chitinophagales bacterium]|nr:rhomboid family intramembrane serine protease [Chitinophagales bacterium]